MATLRPWWPWTWLDSLEASRNGKTDGKKERPRPGHEAPYLAGELKRFTDEKMNRVGLGWSHELQKLQAALRDFEGRAKEARILASSAQQDLTKLLSDYEYVYKEPLTLAGLRNPWPGYWALLLVLFLIELPMNAVVFRTFQESEVLTLVFTLGLSFLLLTGAHVLGHFVKEETEESVREVNSRKTVRKIAIALLLALPLPIIGGIAYYRHTYLQQVTNSRGGALDMTTIFFFALNVFFYAIAAIASYNVSNRLRDQILRVGKTLKQAQATAAFAETAQKRLREKRKRRFDIHRQGAEQIALRAGRLVGIYRKHNERARGDLLQWLDEPAWEMPAALRAPTWDD
jgi:arginine exporter protein ArgO